MKLQYKIVLDMEGETPSPPHLAQTFQIEIKKFMENFSKTHKGLSCTVSPLMFRSEYLKGSQCERRRKLTSYNKSFEGFGDK